MEEYVIIEKNEEITNQLYMVDIKDYFTENELNKTVNNRINNSINVRFLIKKKILDFLETTDNENLLKFKEIEILNNNFGTPEINLSDNIKNLLKKAGFEKIIFSLSHSRDYSCAYVIFCKNGE
jgi:phosphopantetheine--protein transferase-like protein